MRGRELDGRGVCPENRKVVGLGGGRGGDCGRSISISKVNRMYGVHHNQCDGMHNVHGLLCTHPDAGEGEGNNKIIAEKCKKETSI